MDETSFPRRGELWWVSLDPTLGSEIKKTRPCLIIQNDVGNRHAPTTIVAPVTSTPYRAPIVVEVAPSKKNGLRNTAYVNLAQIRCVDKRRLSKPIGTLSEEDLALVNQAIRRSLDV